jgi:hypothetical protein
LHHSSSGLKRVSIKNNRGNFGNGTKTERWKNQDLKWKAIQ